MRVRTSLMTSIGIAAGAVAAVVVYQSAAGASDAAPSPAAATHPAPARITTTWLPCAKGWKLQGQTCIRIKERVVVVHDRAVGSAPSASAARATWVPASVMRNARPATSRTAAPVRAHSPSPATTPSSGGHETEQPEPQEPSATPGSTDGGGLDQ